MRIASINLHWPRTKDSGVGKKLDQQIRLWQAGGHEARLFMHTSRYTLQSDLIPAEIIPYDPAGKIGTELNRIEDETDEMGMALTRSLFAQEDSMKPVSVMFWYQLIQWVGDLADYAEKVGDRLRLLIAR